MRVVRQGERDGQDSAADQHGRIGEWVSAGGTTFAALFVTCYVSLC